MVCAQNPWHKTDCEQKNVVNSLCIAQNLEQLSRFPSWDELFVICHWRTHNRMCSSISSLEINFCSWKIFQILSILKEIPLKKPWPMSLEIQCMFMVHVKMILGVVKKQNFRSSWNLINKTEWKVYTRNSTSYIFYINAYMLKLKIWLVGINWLIFRNCVTTNWILKQLTLWLHITGCRSLLQCLSHLIMCSGIYLG